MNTSERSRLKNVGQALLGLLGILLVLGFAIFGEEAMSTLTHTNRNCAAAAGMLVPNAAGSEAVIRSTTNADCTASGAAAAIGFVTGSGLAAHVKREPGAFLLFGAGITGFVFLAMRRRKGGQAPETGVAGSAALHR